MSFAYQARDAAGRVREGQIAAADRSEATRQLRDEGLYPLALEDQSEATDVEEMATLFQKRISRSDVIYLTNQLAVLIDAGVPVSNALNGLARQSQNPTEQQLLQQVQHDVESGDDFSTALSRFPKQFDRTYVNLVKASEVSGTLGAMLDRLSTQMRTEWETRQKVRGALMYPAAMLMMCIAVCVFLLTYVFPKLTPMISTRGIEIPRPTRLLMMVSDAFTYQWYWILLGVTLLVTGFLYARKQPWGQNALDWLWLHVPIWGTVQRKVALGRSMRTLATTVNAGVPMLEAIQLTGGVANNVLYERCWERVGDQVAGGRQINESLEGHPLFPPTLLQMIAAGESTGKLGPVLNKVSDYYEREVANAIQSASRLIEPLMVLVMGAVIGTIALAMLLPIFQISTHVG